MGITGDASMLLLGVMPMPGKIHEDIGDSQQKDYVHVPPRKDETDKLASRNRGAPRVSFLQPRNFERLVVRRTGTRIWTWRPIPDTP